MQGIQGGVRDSLEKYRNDAEKEKSLSNGTVRIISFDTFVKQSQEIIGAKLDSRLPQKLTEYLRNRANGGQED